MSELDSKIKELKPVSAMIDGDSVIIRFADGVCAIFHPYTHGFGYQIEGLRAVILKDEHGKIIVQYSSRLYRCGPQPDEHKIFQMEDGWTVARLVAYWESAKKYCSELFWGEGGQQLGREPNRKRWYEWRVTSEGWIDLASLKEIING